MLPTPNQLRLRLGMIGGTVAIGLGFCGLVWSLQKPELLWNSLFVVFLSMLLAWPIGAWIGWVVGWTRIPGRCWWMALIFAWAMTPLTVQLTAWDSLWGRLSWISVFTTVDYAPWFRGVAAVAWVQGWAAVPWVALFLLAIRQTVSANVEEAAMLEMPLAKIPYRITWPQHRPLIILVALLVGFRIFEQFEVTDVYQVRTWPEVWYLGFALGQFEGWGSGATDPAALWNFLFGTQLSESAWGTTASTADSNLHRWGFFWIAGSLLAILGGWIAVLSSGLRAWLRVVRTWQWNPDLRLSVPRPKLWLFGLFCLVLLPQLIIWLNLLIRAGLRVSVEADQVLRRWRLEYLWEALTHAASDYRGPLVWSWTIGFVAALAVWLIAVPAAWYGHRYRIATVLAFVVAVVSIMFPAPLVSLVWYRLLHLSNWEWLYDLANRSILGPVVAITFKQLGIGILFWWIVFRQQPQSWREELQLTGIRRARQFWHLAIRAPLAGHVFFLLLITVIGAGDLSTSFATLPPGMDTLPRRLMGDLHSGASGQVAAAALLQLTAVWGAALLLFRLYQCND